MYILIEDKTCSSYSKAIEVLKSYCPDFDSDSLMVDFEKAEHSAIRSHFIDAIIKGCLFHWKQCLNRKFKAVVGYEDNELLRNDISPDGHPQRIQRGVRVEDSPDDYRATSNKEAPQQHHQDEGAS